METSRVVHELPPVFSKESRVLILGSIPSPKSRETGFYYGHPQNRFWKVLAGVLGCSVPSCREEKTQMLLSNKIALWDVLASCSIKGAADSTIKDAAVNDITEVTDRADICAVFLTGKTAYKYYEKYISGNTDLPYFLLPSPSSANCANYTLAKLIDEYGKILEYI